MSEPLFPIAYRDDALAVAIPGDVVDPAGDDMVLALGVLGAVCIPYPYAT